LLVDDKEFLLVDVYQFNIELCADFIALAAAAARLRCKHIGGAA